MNLYPYDCECYPDIFTLDIKELHTGRWWLFEISDRRNDSDALREFLADLHNTPNVWMVGFNNVHYDYELVHHFMVNLNGKAEPMDMYTKSCQIFQDNDYRSVWASDRLIPQIDLYLVHHFNNKARATSLKALQFQMRLPNIQDLPYTPGSYLTSEEKDKLIDYNHKDRDDTESFLIESKDAILFRKQLSDQYNRDFMNHNDGKIGKDYFIMKLTELGYNIKVNGQLVQTFRPFIRLADAVFDWIQFTRPQFQAVKHWFQQQEITETKGVFSEIPEHELEDVAQYATMKKKRVRVSQDEPIHLPCWEERAKTTPTRYKCFNQAKTLNVVVDGFQFDFGVGGIHGSLHRTAVHEDEYFTIIDLDVASYYPNLAIANRVYPEHLGEQFCDIYSDVYQQRKAAKKAGQDSIQAMLKLALNSVYGDSNSVYSPFYDPLYTMTITINGQLLLCLLAERLMYIPELKMIQINTDGLTVKIPRQFVHMLKQVWTEWEKETGLELEDAVYKSMFIRDVNNYLAVGVDGSVKRKGAYNHISPVDKNYKAKERLDWSKDSSSLVVPKAAEAYLVHGTPIREFITNHTDIFDFMLREKVPKTMRIELMNPDGSYEQVQNTTRYYVAKGGRPMFKVMPPLEQGGKERRNGVCAGWMVQECNNMMNVTLPIDYEYYISEAKKLIELS